MLGNFGKDGSKERTLWAKKRITEKTGISEDQARSAVNTVSGFLKEKLPEPIAGQIDNVLSGAGGMSDTLSGAAAKIGNMFGGS